MDIKKPSREGAQYPSTEIRHSIPGIGEPPSRSDETTTECKSQNGFLPLWERSDTLSTGAPVTHLGRSGHSSMDQDNISETNISSPKVGVGYLSENSNEPHVQREENLTEPDLLKRGWLKNGNLSGDFLKATRCGAHSRRTGEPCKQPAMSNGKCRLHGGLSTGPKTPQGLAMSRKTNWQHGIYSAELKTEKEAFRQFLRQTKELLRKM